MNILTGLLVAFTMAPLLMGILFLVIKVDQKINLEEISVNILPKYKIAFITTDSLIRYSHPIETYVGSAIIVSSKNRAISILNSSYSRGYFIDSDNNTYPTSSISKAYVVKC